MAIPISAIALTKNEEGFLPDCLASLAWADEILVVDSLSTDATLSIARRAATRVVQHPFSNFAAQRNFAQTQARHDWILFIDADERVSPELQDEIKTLAATGRLAECNAYHIRRAHLFSGRWLGQPQKITLTRKMCENTRRSEVPRLLDRRQATWTRALHEQVVVPEPHGVLEGAILHYSGSNLSRALQDFNWFTDLEAARLHAQRTSGRRPSLIEALARGFRLFVFMYFGWGLFKYGEQGFLMAAIGAFTKFMNYAKLSERLRIQSDVGIWAEHDRKLLTRFQVDDWD
jgi:glycosyltransferase involved in cell wall biosynthesis